MAEFRQRSISTKVLAGAGETRLNKRVFGYSLKAIGLDANVIFYKGPSVGGNDIWEDDTILEDKTKCFNFAHEPLGDPEEDQDIFVVVTGGTGFCHVRHH